MAYLLGNICTKNYSNRATIVEIIVGGWVVSFLETECGSRSLPILNCRPKKLQTYIKQSNVDLYSALSYKLTSKALRCGTC